MREYTRKCVLRYEECCAYVLLTHFVYIFVIRAFVYRPDRLHNSQLMTSFDSTATLYYYQ
jgi:hypothetical protein